MNVYVSVSMYLQIFKGFSNWKDATVSFKKHEQSSCHREAVEVMVSLPVTTRDIGEMLSQQHAKEKEGNRKVLLKILANVKFLARQGLAFRGDGNESDGNFLQLLKLRAEEDPSISEWLARKANKYTSHEIQDEFLRIMAHQILRQIASNLQMSPFLTIMADETTDASNYEQVTIVLRWVTEDFQVHEEFIGLYQVPSTDAETLTTTIKDTLTRLNLPLAKIRGQCYDGASAMSGSKSGVAKRIQDLEPRAVYTHCYGHSLNLAASDTMKSSELMRNALETTHEITKLIKYSPRRDGIFHELKESHATNSTPGIRVLCPTRWTVRADSLASIINNFEVLQSTWISALQVTRDTEVKARIQGVSAQMKSFQFLFGVMLGELVLRHTDNLSRTLQHKTFSAAEGQEIARMTVKTLQSIRSSELFDLFWSKVSSTAESLDVEEPQLPRRRRIPKRFDDGTSAGDFHSTPKEYYRPHYYEAIDTITTCITDRFDQPGYRVYSEVEQLLLKACKREDFDSELKVVCLFYKDDFDPTLLCSQLHTFAVNFNEEGTSTVSIFDIRDYFMSLSCAQRVLLSQVSRLVQLLLIMPPTNATSERSFSALRRVKNYLRTTMQQQRLNINLLVMHVHKECTDHLDLRSTATEFIGDSEHRLRIYGKFRQNQSENV